MSTAVTPESRANVAEGELVLPEPVGKQEAMLESPAARKVLRWGRRSGKTRGAFLAALLGHGPIDAHGMPMHRGVLQGGDVVWICPTYANLSTVLWKEEIVPRMGHLPWITLNKQDHDITIPGVGSLLLRSGDREAIDNVRGVGKRLFGVIIDEAAHMDSRGALLDVILPALLDNDGWLILMSTTNAGADGGYDDTGAPQMPSYFNQICEQIETGQRSDDWQHFFSTARDNPLISAKGIQGLIDEYPPGSPQLFQEVYAELLTTGVGLALPGLSEATHMVKAFQPPDHWHRWYSFDWGYHHPWAFGSYTIDEDGQVYQCDGVTGRMDLPEQIDEKLRKSGVDPRYNVFAGPDVWRTRVSEKGKIMGQFEGPTVAERLQQLGWKLVPAADARVAGLNNLRRYTFIDPIKQNRPRFLWMDTPNNKASLAQIARMPLDPKNPEDALKVNADAAGRGGDDWYDSDRYGLMARPLLSLAPPAQDEEGHAMPYDFEKKQQRKRETGDEALQKLIGLPESATVGRYRVPVRRG
jgi:hypothetical protein